ncbi:MAG: hypothetical protein ACPIOQ_47865, partial [Promethearchaeia archaeon]
LRATAPDVCTPRAAHGAMMQSWMQPRRRAWAFGWHLAVFLTRCPRLVLLRSCARLSFPEERVPNLALIGAAAGMNPTPSCFAHRGLC